MCNLSIKYLIAPTLSPCSLFIHGSSIYRSQPLHFFCLLYTKLSLHNLFPLSNLGVRCANISFFVYPLLML
uniref:Uncharacterized protein n=1 Tax=Arundo donax TaxID=35708 RepID=A0A0A9FRE8_ARUDO